MKNGPASSGGRPLRLSSTQLRCGSLAIVAATPNGFSAARTSATRGFTAAMVSIRQPLPSSKLESADPNSSITVSIRIRNASSGFSAKSIRIDQRFAVSILGGMSLQAAPFGDEERDGARHLAQGVQIHPLVEAVIVLGERSIDQRRDPRIEAEEARVGGGGD